MTVRSNEGPLDPQVIFTPRSVAVIGASSNPAGHAGRALTNLVRTGFAGSIHPVNPKYDELQGLRCYPDVASIEQAPEVVYVLLPAERAVEAVRQAGQAGVRLAVVCSSGFSELGEAGNALQRELCAIAADTGIRVIGPNCIGIVSPHGSFVGAPTFNITYDQRPGGVAILSHSGGLGVTVFNRAQEAGTGVHSMVSLGNEADLTMADLLESMLLDDQVHTIAMVVEQIRDPQRFMEAARRAVAAGKYLVALKTGKSEAGSAAVAGHTGALAGNAAAFSAVLRELGVIEATTVDELVDVLQLRDRVPAKRVGRRLAVVSPSGGETVYVADRAGAYDVVLPPLPEELRVRLQEWMPLGNPANPLDLTGQIIGDSALLAKVLDAMGDRDDVDLVMVCLATWGEYDADAILAKVIDAARAVTTPVVFTAWEAGAMTRRVEETLRDSGLAWFASPDRALAALSLVSQKPVPTPPGAPALERSVTRPVEAHGGSLGEVAAASVLGAAGIPMVQSVIASDAEDAVARARDWGEVVLKIHAPALLHKSEFGLVEIGPRGPEAVRAAAERLLARASEHSIAHEGILVARREQGAEVIVGGVRDATFGPFVLVGAGGILAEFFADTALISAPATPESVRAALESLSSWSVIQGVRGAQHDVDALIDLVVSFSKVFAVSHWMREVDLNPVIVRTIEQGGAVAVDAVIVTEAETSS